MVFVDTTTRKKERKKNRPVYRVAAQLKRSYIIANTGCEAAGGGGVAEHCLQRVPAGDPWSGHHGPLQPRRDRTHPVQQLDRPQPHQQLCNRCLPVEVIPFRPWRNKLQLIFG